MRRVMVILSLAACACIVLNLQASARRRPFIRGIYLVRNADCIGYDSSGNRPCCPNNRWDNERGLLTSLHANNIMGWDWPERDWMDSVCNANNGAVKKWTGYQGYIADNAWNYQSPSWRSEVDASAQDQYDNWGSDTGLFGYFVGHEVRATGGRMISDYYPGFNYMCDAVNALDPNRYTSMIMTSKMITPEFPVLVPHLDYVESEFYPYRGDTPPCDGSAPPNPTPPSGQTFQTAIDGGVNEMNNMMNWFKDDSVSWIVNIQTGAWHGGYYDQGRGCWPVAFQGSCDQQTRQYMSGAVQPITVDYRFPSREEMRLTAFIGISRGAKGIRAFTYGTNFDPYTINWGLLHFRRREIFHPTDHAPWDNLSNYYPNDFKYNYPPSSNPPFLHISDLYSDLEAHEDLLINLYVTAAGSYRQKRDSTVTFIKGVRCSDSASVVPPGYWWEAATFIDTASVDRTQYFMLINRITCNTDTGSNWEPAGYRTCNVIFTWPDGFAPVIQDIFSNEMWFLTISDSTTQGYGWWTFTDSVGPGDGNIYRIENTLTGPITSDVTLNHDAILTGDLGLVGGGDIHDDAPFEHLGQPGIHPVILVRRGEFIR